MKSPKEICGLALMLTMNKEFEEAQKSGSYQAIKDFCDNWNVIWIKK